MAVKCPGLKIKDSMTVINETTLGLVRAKSPHVSVAKIRKPHRAMRNANGIATRSEPLLHHLVRRRINLANGDLEHRGPNMARAKCDFTARARDAHLDIG